MVSNLFCVDLVMYVIVIMALGLRGSREREIHTHNLALLSPLPLRLLGPDLHFAIEARARGFQAGSAGRDVVAAELVGSGEGLHEGKRGGRRGVDF